MLQISFDFGAQIIREVSFLDALVSLSAAFDQNTGLLEGALEGPDAAAVEGEPGDNITGDDIPFGLISSQNVELIGPLFVSDLGCSEGDLLHVGENVFLVDVDEGDSCQGASETDSCDVEGLVSGLLLEIPKIPGDVGLDFAPHVEVGGLDVAAGTEVRLFLLGVDF